MIKLSSVYYIVSTYSHELVYADIKKCVVEPVRFTAHNGTSVSARNQASIYKALVKEMHE